MGKEIPDVPLHMRKAHRRLNRWLGAHTGRWPIPDRIWAAAAELAREHGVFPTARAVRLEYGKRKERAEAAGRVTMGRGAKLRHESDGGCSPPLDRVLTVGQSKTHAGTGRLIPLNSAAVRALADWAERFPEHEPVHYVFPACENARIDTAASDYSRVDPPRPIKSWRTAWRNATRNVVCPECGIRQRPALRCSNAECQVDLGEFKNSLAELIFHDLRHCAITKLAESQASDQTIMSIAGHVSRQMLEHYSHIRIAAKRAALDAISTRLPECKMPALKGKGNQKGNQIEVHNNEAAGNLLN